MFLRHGRREDKGKRREAGEMGEEEDGRSEIGTHIEMPTHSVVAGVEENA